MGNISLEEEEEEEEESYLYIISIRERLEYRPFGDLRSLQKAASTKSFFFSFPPQFCDVGNQVGNHP